MAKHYKVYDPQTGQTTFVEFPEGKPLEGKGRRIEEIDKTAYDRHVDSQLAATASLEKHVSGNDQPLIT
jgi:hypothetical protein